MKIQRLAILLTLPAVVTLGRADTKWTHYLEGGEDATSTFYHFFNGGPNGPITKIRWVWNGGAQKLPTITDYHIGAGAIRIKKMTAARSALPELIAGRDAKFEITLDYTLSCKDSKHMLVPPGPDKHLTDHQRIDLYNLISLLAMEKRPIEPDGQNKAPQGKREGVAK
jgi:hypothetical protein